MAVPKPALKLDLVLDDRRIDLIREGFDLAIRGSDRLEDSSLVVRKLAHLPHVLCASPAYLREHGVPASPSALSEHRLIRFSLSGHADSWVFNLLSTDQPVRQEGISRKPFGRKKRVASVSSWNEVVETVPVHAVYSVSSSLAVRDALVAGMGISLIPQLYVADDLRAGRLRAVLPDWKPVSTALYVVYPCRQYLSPKVRVFVDFLMTQFTTSPAVQGGEE